MLGYNSNYMPLSEAGFDVAQDGGSFCDDRVTSDARILAHDRNHQHDHRQHRHADDRESAALM
jgi:hypothetical protein